MLRPFREQKPLWDLCCCRAIPGMSALHPLLLVATLQPRQAGSQSVSKSLRIGALQLVKESISSSYNGRYAIIAAVAPPYSQGVYKLIRPTLHARASTHHSCHKCPSSSRTHLTELIVHQQLLYRILLFVIQCPHDGYINR